MAEASHAMPKGMMAKETLQRVCDRPMCLHEDGGYDNADRAAANGMASAAITMTKAIAAVTRRQPSSTDLPCRPERW